MLSIADLISQSLKHTIETVQIKSPFFSYIQWELCYKLCYIGKNPCLLLYSMGVESGLVYCTVYLIFFNAEVYICPFYMLSIAWNPNLTVTFFLTIMTINSYFLLKNSKKFILFKVLQTNSNKF